MTVAEISVLHGRYVRLTDRFKSMWTYHQFASGAFKNFLKVPLPYKIDFQNTFDRMKVASTTLNAAQAGEAAAALGLCELALDRAAAELLRADEKVTASLLRRFFEKLKRHDEAIVNQLIKFYLYTQSIDGEHRDKLDFLFTRIGEEFSTDRGEYDSRDSLEFRERIIALVSLMRMPDAPQQEVVRLIRAVHTIRDDIRGARAFEELTEKNLLANARVFKHRLGHLYFHPDILLAIIELNVAAKNKFMRLYADDEHRIVDDATRLVAHGEAIERNFGGKNPDLMQEIARFREFKERFDAARADCNIKHDVITRLKQSMTTILGQLDHALGVEDTRDLPPTFFADLERAETIRTKLGCDAALEPFVNRIVEAIDPLEPEASTEEIGDTTAVRELRLEPWEIDACRALFHQRPCGDDEQLCILFVTGAAVRMRVDEEAKSLAAARATGIAPDDVLLTRAHNSLDCAKAIDEAFARFLHDAVYGSKPEVLHELYRSRFRLLRAFSGLWLIYDRGGSEAS